MRPAIVDWLAPLIGRDLAVLIAPTWFTFVALAGIAGGWLIVRAARRAGDDTAAVTAALMWGYAAALVCGVLGPLAGDLLEQLAAGGAVRLRWPGMTSFWGYAGAIAAVALVLRKHDTVTLARFGDLTALPIGVALVLARLGCFTAGCDYGTVTSGWTGVRFPAGSPAWHDHVHSGLVPATRDVSLAVHPSQLYEALVGIAIVVAVVAASRLWRNRFDGALFLVAAGVYGAGRWLVENTRGDDARGFVAGMSFGQAFCIVLLAAIALAAFASRRRARTALAAACLCAAIAAAPAPSVAQPSATAPGDAPEPDAGALEDPYAEEPAPGPASTAEAPGRARTIEVSVRLGSSAPLNRRERQIPMLGGAGLAAYYSIDERIAIGLEVDALANSVATHQGFVASATSFHRVNDKLAIRSRLGIGTTAINFHDAAFNDVSAFTYRLGADATYAVNERWSIHVRPLAFDFVHASAIGGTIASWQLELGVGYRTSRLGD